MNLAFLLLCISANLLLLGLAFKFMGRAAPKSNWHAAWAAFIFFLSGAVLGIIVTATLL